ncbi:MAG: F0F1 ATP synthase subunit epsilon [Lachnospiraceae bacterium]
MSSYPLKILTPEESVYENPVTSITLEGAKGRLTVLGGHAPMIAAVVEGRILIKTGEGELAGHSLHGLLHVKRDEVVVLVRDFHWANETPEPLLPPDSKSP